jgi:dTDP-4-dehydrorhamnose 3,5-epimerase
MIHGVQVKPLTMNRDSRGCLTEIFGDSWGLSIRPVQWSVVASGPRVLRGMHLHFRHDEYFLVLRGRACVGLYDFRADSPTAGASRLLEFNGEQMCALVFPPGILHGWYFYEASLHLRSVSESYTAYHHDDNLGCLWSDPELNLPWPDPTPLLSGRAASFPRLAQLAASLGRGERGPGRE